MTLSINTRPAATRPAMHRPVSNWAIGAPAPVDQLHAPRVRPASPHGGRQDRLPVPRPVRPVSQAARDLLADAGRGLGRAIRADLPTDRYAAAHLAALRGAAAILATKARPGRSRQASAWTLLSKLAPEFAEWGTFFAAGSAKRQAAEAGITRLISAREADDMVRQCAIFLDLVEAAL